MSRYKPTDLARLGPDAQKQIRLTMLAATMQELEHKRRNKYGAEHYTDADGQHHDSKGEGRRWEELKLMQRSGLITNLIHQPSFDLIVNGVPICKYRADAEYYTADGERVVEDFKSPATVTPLYRVKRALMAAIHGITITEVRR
jgi:hypothetical protein